MLEFRSFLLPTIAEIFTILAVISLAKARYPIQTPTTEARISR